MKYFIYSFSIRDRCLASFTKIGAFLKAYFLVKLLSKPMYIFKVEKDASVTNGIVLEYWCLEKNFSFLMYIKSLFTASQIGWGLINFAMRAP